MMNMRMLRMIGVIALAVCLAGCVRSVSASWVWKAQNAAELAGRGRQVVSLLSELEYVPSNSVAKFEDGYQSGGMGFVSNKNHRIWVSIFIDSTSNNLTIEISEAMTDKITPSGYKHYLGLRDKLNTLFGEDQLKHRVYDKSFRSSNRAGLSEPDGEL